MMKLVFNSFVSIGCSIFIKLCIIHYQPFTKFISCNLCFNKPNLRNFLRKIDAFLMERNEILAISKSALLIKGIRCFYLKHAGVSYLC